MSRFDYTEAEREAEYRLKRVRRLEDQAKDWIVEYNTALAEGDQFLAAYAIKRFYQAQDELAELKAA